MRAMRRTAVWLVCVLALAASAGCKSDKNKVALPESQPAANKGADKADAKADDPAKALESGGPKATEALDNAAPTRRRLSGSFEAQRQTNVAAKVGGIIRDVYVEEGDVVDKGDRLINIDGEDYRLRVQQAQAGLNAAQAQLSTIKTQYKRIERLHNQKAVADSRFDQLAGQMQATEAQVDQAKVGLRMARNALKDAIIRAPYAGVITKVSVAEGDFAAPGPQPLIHLVEVQKLYLRVHVPEEYADSVHKGDKLEVHVPSLNKDLELSVDRINPTIKSRSRSFDVLAEVDNPKLEVRPGMYAQVTLASQAHAPQAAANDGEKQ